MSRIKIKFPKEIEILSSVYSVTYDKSHGGGILIAQNQPLL